VSDWEPGRYLAYADERSRPFADLLARVAAADPQRVVDLGCGPGNLTIQLAERWAHATVLGVDSSAAMIARARAVPHPRVQFEQADVRDWRAEGPIDVVISNAVLQWVPGHRELLPRFVAALAPKGWFACQVPGNFSAPSHELLRELAAEERFAAHTSGLSWPATAEPAEYLADLAALGCAVDVWETTYLHVLTGDDPVFGWISSTGARPVLQALPSPLRKDFEAEFKARLRRAYPPTPYGTVLPFRRIFVVARAPDPREK
jgi:trans-aconitate 2-methyltransferase